MSEGIELLDNLTEEEITAYTAESETEQHIVVGKDRIVMVPNELKRIAVQYDHNIETVTFDCPRYWDDHDMSAMKIYICYMLADGSVGSYIADDVRVDEVDDTVMHFDWTITRNVTYLKGTVSFLVCVRNVDDDGNEKNHWNSELCKDMYVSQGMECHETILEKYPDIITQLLTRIDTTDASVEAVKEDVQTLDENKVDKFKAGASKYTLLYASTSSGEQQGITMRVAPIANTVVQRDESGQIQVPTMPTSDRHATPKGYVDKLVESSACQAIVYGGYLGKRHDGDSYKLAVIYNDHFKTINNITVSDSYLFVMGNAVRNMNYPISNFPLVQSFYFTVIGTDIPGVNDGETYNTGDLVLFIYKSSDSFEWLKISSTSNLEARIAALEAAQAST